MKVYENPQIEIFDAKIYCADIINLSNPNDNDFEDSGVDW